MASTNQISKNTEYASELTSTSSSSPLLMNNEINDCHNNVSGTNCNNGEKVSEEKLKARSVGDKNQNMASKDKTTKSKPKDAELNYQSRHNQEEDEADTEISKEALRRRTRKQRRAEDPSRRQGKINTKTEVLYAEGKLFELNKCGYTNPPENSELFNEACLFLNRDEPNFLRNPRLFTKILSSKTEKNFEKQQADAKKAITVAACEEKFAGMKIDEFSQWFQYLLLTSAARYETEGRKQRIVHYILPRENFNKLMEQYTSEAEVQPCDVFDWCQDLPEQNIFALVNLLYFCRRAELLNEAFTTERAVAFLDSMLRDNHIEPEPTGKKASPPSLTVTRDNKAAKSEKVEEWKRVLRDFYSQVKNEKLTLGEKFSTIFKNVYDRQSCEIPQAYLFEKALSHFIAKNFHKDADSTRTAPSSSDRRQLQENLKKIKLTHKEAVDEIIDGIEKKALSFYAIKHATIIACNGNAISTCVLQLLQKAATAHAVAMFELDERKSVREPEVREQPGLYFDVLHAKQDQIDAFSNSVEQALQQLPLINRVVLASYFYLTQLLVIHSARFCTNGLNPVSVLIYPALYQIDGEQVDANKNASLQLSMVIAYYIKTVLGDIEPNKEFASIVTKGVEFTYKNPLKIDIQNLIAAAETEAAAPAAKKSKKKSKK